MVLMIVSKRVVPAGFPAAQREIRKGVGWMSRKSICEWVSLLLYVWLGLQCQVFRAIMPVRLSSLARFSSSGFGFEAGCAFDLHTGGSPAMSC